MLLNTWLSTARRHFNMKSGTRRVARSASRHSGSVESLETRSLLTALVINPDTRAGYLNAAGGLVIDNADMVGKDALVIEGFSISASSGNALTINLSGITLKSLAIESMVVTQHTSVGMDISLTNVSELQTIAVENVTIAGSRLGLDLTLTHTNADALTIDDSSIPGVRIEALSGSELRHGLITESTIVAGAGFEGVLLNVNAGTADNFHIENNLRITSANRDFVRINSTNAPVDGLTIQNNQIGSLTQGSGLIFRADGDTFVQPLTLTNNSTQGELIGTFVFDVSGIGLQFDPDAVTGKPFAARGTSGTTTGLLSSVLSNNNQVLTLTFNTSTTTAGAETFAPGETLQFDIDIDLVGPVPAAIFGDDLIGADVSAVLTGNRTLAGQMIGDPDKVTASEFAIGPRSAGTTQGIIIDLTNAPTTNMVVAGNTVLGAPGHAFQIAADRFSDVTGVIRDNVLNGAGKDGIRFDMTDSNFTGAVVDNEIQGNGQNGISILPTVSRSGQVEAVLDASTVVVTSTNHGLVTGDQIILQGLVNDDPTVNHPGNGLHTVTRIDNNRFRLNAVDGTAVGVRYVGGGTWYVPDFQSDGTARGLVTVDMQSTIPRGVIRAATNTSSVIITSPNHGLVSGQRIRVSNVAGNTAANGVKKITVIDADSFRLDSTVGNGAYDTTNGFGTWTANVVTNVSNGGNMLATSPGHGLKTGDEIRLTGVLGNTAANGTFKVTVLDADRFYLKKAGNGVYTGGGNWVRINDTTSTGDRLPQRIGGNLITSNGQAGIYVDVTTGTVFNGDIVGNTFSANAETGLNMKSHSFGLGTSLPLDPAQPSQLPSLQDVGFDVNIGTNAAGDGNVFEQNTRAGILLQALDYGTASFRIYNNTISRTLNDADTVTSGDGIVLQLTNDLSPTEAVSLFSESIIDGNNIGVDNGGNAGHGLLFKLGQRTRIQDLQLTNTAFLNNTLDGFHFERSEDARLNSLIIEKNRATNNGGDGFDISSQNTTKDELDLHINENVIDQNAQYGVRLALLADVRVAVEFDNNSVTGNGHTAGGTGFHPNDGVAGSAGSTGGVGILAFEEIGIQWSMTGTHIDSNIGDGFSIDAFNQDDVLITHMNVTNSTFNDNTLTGLRNQGTSFGSLSFVGSEFNANGEDGVRMVSTVDRNDTFYRRRVGGRDIDVTGLANQFIGNGQSGVQLGQGVSASFGDGSITNVNYFNSNGEDGLKLTQHNSPHADRLGLRRLVQTNRNFFQNNISNGIDVGHDASQETGNVEHGDEVASDLSLVVNNAVISGNRSDGIEYLADSGLRIPRVIGGGQDISFLARTSMAVSNSRIAQNTGRGIDILNRQSEDSFISLINNDVLSNRMEGIYVVNTAASTQLQRDSADVLEWVVTPIGGQIELRVQDNLIESNGNATNTSRVAIEDSAGSNDRTGQPSNGTVRNGEAVSDWIPATEQIPGTLGGLVIRVGTVDTIGTLISANAGWELGQSGIDAEVWKNSFDGNFGADVYFDNFVSAIAPWTRSNFDAGDDPDFVWDVGWRDPLSRLDLSFRENMGNSIDVINGFSYQDNWESEFKSRHSRASSAPDHGHDPLNGPGNWANPGRKRNMTRTIGRYDDDMGVAPGSHSNIAAPGGQWSYDGTGTSTWRVESDFDFSNFPQSSSTDGYSNFYTEVNLNDREFNISPWSYQWDTGIDTGSFTGQTPYSLNRGDIFNVRAGEAPIVADQLDDNNGFVSATNLGSVAGNTSVNARTTNGNLNLNVKGDRDYYRFTAAGTGPLNVVLGATDARGDNLIYTIYEVKPTLRTEEVAMFLTADLLPSYTSVTAGGTRTLTTNVVAGREYVVEILSDEQSSIGFASNGKSFNYGTVRSYSLSINAPAAAPAPILPFAGPVAIPAASTTSGSTTKSGTTASGFTVAAGNVPGARPTAAFVLVSPDPRSTSAGTVTLNFSEDVTGVTITDFKLTRNTINIPLTTSLLRQINTTRYTLNLSNLTGEAGTYALTLVATGSGIMDSDSVLLTSNATDTWIVSNTVTSGIDTPDSNPGDRLAKDVNGVATLRAAIMESNASPGSDVILLGARTHTFSRDGRYEDDSFTGDLDIKGVVTIRGVGPRTTFINAADLDRAFHVFAGATLTLENLTIIGGEAFDGGAIFNQGTVILNNVNIRLNEAYSQGGGIFNAAGADLRVSRSSISQNTAGSRGGAVYNLGATTYISTTISTNVAASRGGGLFNENAASSSLINVTVARNVAASRGGGLYNESSDVRPVIPPTTTIGNSIIEGNSTTARVPATNATIGRDMFGAVRSLGSNLIQVLDRRFLTGTDAGLLTSDKFGRDATPLASSLNGLSYAVGTGVGAHPLKPGSLAVDGGSNTVFPTTPLLAQQDVVGNPRLIEGNRDGVVTIDVGAVELLVNTPIAIFTATPNPAGLSQPVTFNGTASTHPNPATGRIVSWEWDFDYTLENGFTPDAVGSTVTHSFTDVNRTSYTVRLVVTDNFGVSDLIDQVITIGLPTKPIIQRPGLVTTDRTPLFRWTADPTIYRLQLFNVTSGTRVSVLNLTNLTATTYTPATNLALGRYELVITSINGSGGTPSDSYLFRVAPVTLSGPLNNTFDLTPVFNWSNIAGSSRYELRVRRVLPTVVEDVIRDAFISTPSFEATASLGVGQFQWWVRAYDADGTAGEWSDTATFTIGQPTLTRPQDVTVDTTPTFTWTDMDSKPVGQKDTVYELHVNQVGGPARIIYQAALTTTSYTPTIPLPNGTYDAWVRPLAPDGEAGLWSPVRRFVMDFRVGPVTSSPVGITTDSTPTFTWQAADGAANYDLWVDNLSTGATEVIRVLVPHVANATDITYTPTTPLTAGNYRWWVQTIATSGSKTNFSTPTDFTVPVPSIINPRGGISTNLPLFTWSGVTEYVSYELWVDNITTGTSQVLRVNDIIGKSYQTTLPFENGNFKAWVRGKDAAGNFSQWSGVADFTVTTGVGTAPVLNFAFVDNSGIPTFSWRSGSNASTYEIIVKRISDSSQPVVINVRGIQGLSYVGTTALTAGTYRWWIRGLDSTGTALPWSQPRSFTVAASETSSDNLNPAMADVFIPVMYTVQSDNWNSDSVVSISAHPAGNVIQVNSEVVDSVSETMTLPAPQDVATIDSFMEEWAAAAFSMPEETASPAISVAAVTPAAPVAPTKTDDSEKDNYLVDLLMAGMVVGTVLGSGKRSEENE